MIKIVVVSDTHKEYKKYKEIVEANLDSDLFIHLGDGEHEFKDVAALYPEKRFIFVLGNNDYGKGSLTAIVDIGEIKIFCTHGHTLHVQQSLNELIEAAKDKECQIALYGHTHVYRTDMIDGVYVMNPGSVDAPRGKNKPSYGIIQIHPGAKIETSIIATE